jgi:hypothetical protein
LCAAVNNSYPCKHYFNPAFWATVAANGPERPNQKAGLILLAEFELLDHDFERGLLIRRFDKADERCGRRLEAQHFPLQRILFLTHGHDENSFRGTVVGRLGRRPKSIDKPNTFGSPGLIRTSDQPVNSRR